MKTESIRSAWIVAVVAVILGSSFLLPTAAQAEDSVWVRIHHPADDQRLQALAADARLSDYGNFQWGRASASLLQNLQAEGVTVTVLDNPFELNLGERSFDPLIEFPDADSGVASPGENFFLIQFEGPVRSRWLEAVREQGVVPVQYIHPHTYVVWGESAKVSAARGLNGVRWTGAFLPEFRVLPRQRSRDATVVPTMALVSRHVDEDIVRAQMETLGAVVHRFTRVTAQTSVVFLEVAGNRYWDLAQLPAVYTLQYIPPETGPRGEMSNQAVVGNYASDPNNPVIFPGYVNWLNATGYDGSDVVVGVVDGGIRVSHQDLVGNISPCVPSGDTPTSCSTSNNAHGTHVAGAVAGTGNSGITDSNGFLRGQGVAPGASVIQQRYNAFTTFGTPGMIPDGMLKIYRESALSGAIITNNSWGPTGSPQGYDIPTQQIDIITRDALPEVVGNQGVLPVWSIMNGGGDSGGACAPSSLGSPDEAKNLFGVGSTSLQVGSGNTNQVSGTGIFNLGSNSAHGPACDGRTGLHIVAPGWSTDSTTSTNDAAHGTAGGTSMASPVVSGAVAVFIEYYRDLHAGADPSPAMIKAAVTAVASNMHGRLNADGGTITQTPSRFQGYGRLDLDAVVNPPGEVLYFDQEHVFTESGQDWSVPVTADDPDQPMRMMLMWTDAPGHGLGGTTPAWVNDLDLVVATPGDEFFGNVLGSDGFSESGGSRDERNNAEAVFLRPDQHAGAVIDLRVEALTIAEDALDPHDGVEPRQDFALVCYNCRISDSNFTLEIEPQAASICIPASGSEEAAIDIQVGASGSYTGTVDLSATGAPNGVASQFQPASVQAPGNSVWTLAVDASAQAGISELQLVGDDGEDSQQVPLSLTLEAPPGAPLLVSPASSATGVALRPEFAWQESNGANVYTLQVATDAAFTDLVIEESVSGNVFSATSDLAIGTVFYWRVSASDHCGAGDWSEVREFQTRFDPVADVTPTMLDFEIRTGDSGEETLAITNIGSGVLDWNLDLNPCAGGDSPAWLTAVPAAGAVPAGEADAVVVTVDTTTLGIGGHQAELCVTTNQAGAAPIPVAVTVEVVDPPPGEVAIDSSALNFGSVATNLAPTQPVQIANVAAEGSADLAIGQIAVIAGEPVFERASNDCPASLPAQDSCTVEVRFSPNAVSAYSGVLRITVDGQSSNISLLGSGVEPDPEIFGDRFEDGQ